MGSVLFDVHGKQFWESEAIQRLWESYQAPFDFDISKIFGEEYAVKLRFGQFYASILKGWLRDAYSILKGYWKNFRSEYDLMAYERFERICLNVENLQKIGAGDWVKDDHDYYFLVVSGTVESAVIKCAFASGFRPKSSQNPPYFTIYREPLYCYRTLTEEEQAHIQQYFQKHENAYAELTAQTDKYFAYCNALRENAFQEAGWLNGQFYKYLSEETAFIVNIKDCGKYLQLFYGISTASQYPELKEDFEAHGKDVDEITLRACVKIYNAEDEARASEQIARFYERYKAFSKEELLNTSRERRKAFLNRFHALLKPYGFKKKGNRWNREMEGGRILTMYLNKMRYEDNYEICLYIFSQEKEIFPCFSKRYFLRENEEIDWQLVDEAEFDQFLNEKLLYEILYILRTPFEELATTDAIKLDACSRENKCEGCWRKK